LAVAVAVAVMAPTLRSAGWSLTILPRVDSTTRLGASARSLDPGFRTVHPGAYDGQFYWGIAVDPLATGAVHHDFDKASYRYGHPLYGWLGWILSAGQARAAAAALAIVGLASLFAVATLATTLGLARGGSGWQGVVVALNPGLISSAAHDLAEPLAAFLLLGALAAHERGRRAFAWILLALLPLAKEPLLLVLGAVLVWEVVRGQRAAAGIYLTAALPALAWWVYARVQLGAWFTTGDTALGSPFVGWWRGLSAAATSAVNDTGVAALIVLIALLLVAAARALRLRSTVDYTYLGLAAVAACLAPNATVAFTTALRNTAFLVLLLPFVLPASTLESVPLKV